ncbi:unnamed protein product [Darwinula stevensoni]|uniref:Uncharacterized protein n=1 Tax=Darwinula stevensoni TaxID=69355 RepID=A0A7R8X661_9CRUS|nr:unnamed protein product [Darwinula stevensoni]CAG0887818.1 unnamed protein product [Darwinula stevensoni]
MRGSVLQSTPIAREWEILENHREDYMKLGELVDELSYVFSPTLLLSFMNSVVRTTVTVYIASVNLSNGSQQWLNVMMRTGDVFGSLIRLLLITIAASYLSDKIRSGNGDEEETNEGSENIPSPHHDVQPLLRAIREIY